MPHDTPSPTDDRAETTRPTSAMRIVLIAAVAAVLITTAIVVTRPTGHSTTAASPLTPVAVMSGDLSTSERIDGTVVYSDVTTVLHRIAGTTTGPRSSAQATQTVTSVLTVGASVSPGTVLYSVESQPVVALTGTTPAWRTMSTGITDGNDILQLETSLAALGYDPAGSMTIDGHFDSRTKAVVQAWQLGYGLTVTGKVTLGEVVFLAGTTTVSEASVKVGDSVSDGDTILSLAGSSQQVVIGVPSGDESTMLPGLAVKVGDVDATVTLLRSVVRNGAIVVEAVLTPTAPIAEAGNGSTVKVTVDITDRKGVLIVPAAALVSRLDGTYAVQVLQPDGTSAFVTVEILAVAGLQVGIRGDGITAGAQVLQPA